MVYLRTSLRLPVETIQTYLETNFESRMSVGETQALTHRARQELQPQADALKAAVQTSTVVHGDETGWCEDGHNRYERSFAISGPTALRYSEHSRSRGHEVPKQILVPTFRGWLVSDLYGPTI